jgi:hypothetical protein
MDCLTFTKWLENRDMYDVSEADKALKHTTQCGECKRVLRLDEQLDKRIFDALKPVVMPDSLKSKVDLSLDRVSSNPSKRLNSWYGIVPAALAAMVIFFISFPFSSGITSMDELGKHVIADHGHHGDSVLVVTEPEKINTLGSTTIEYDSVKNSLPENFTFVGARICPLGDCSAIHMVFMDKGKRVSLYVVKETDVNFSLSYGRQYSMTAGEQVVRFWKKDGNIFAMIT